MNKDTLQISPPLSYFFMNNIHIILLIGVCFLFKVFVSDYIIVVIGLFVLSLLFKLGFSYLQFLSIKFTITEERVISEFGFFNTKIDYLEMYRIYDYQMNRSLLQKILNLMNVDLVTRDISTPVLRLHGISYNPELVNEIRNRVEYSKKVNNILELNQIT